MKEQYFSGDSLPSRASAMRRQAQSLGYRRDLPFFPSQSALLVLDMQNYFLDPSSHAYIPSAPTILPNICALVQAYRSRQLPIIFTRHLNREQDAGMMSHWWRDLIRPESPLSQINFALDTADDPVILKSQYDAFYNTPLEETLRRLGARQVLISGVMTHLCCETTARSAFIRGFEVFFLVDATAAYNAEFHQASLLNLAHGFATLLLCGEVLAACEAL